MDLTVNQLLPPRFVQKCLEEKSINMKNIKI